MALAVCSHVVCEKCDRVLSKLYAAAERARIIALLREEADKFDPKTRARALWALKLIAEVST